MRWDEVMRAKSYEEKRVKDWSTYRVEPKMDGVRVICTVQRDNVIFYSRNARALNMFGHLDKSMLRLANRLDEQFRGYERGVMFDGEMCGSTFNEIGGAIHRKDHTEETAKYHVFHAMPIKLFNAGEDDCEQTVRRYHLKVVTDKLTFAGVVMVASKRITGDLELKQVYKDFRKKGYEGLILKNMMTAWRAKRSHDWMKIKDSKTEDLPIVGWKPGKGKFTGTLGAIYVSNKGKRVSVSGMDDAVRDWLFKRRKKLETGTMIAEVEFQQVTSHGSLRHPRFIKIRKDKERS